MTDELKPCPFCGGSARSNAKSILSEPSVMCMECWAIAPSPTAWNSRVVKEHREPREFWLAKLSHSGIWMECSPNTPGTIKFREVLDDD